MNIKKLLATVLIVVGAISTASANDIESIKKNLKVEFFEIIFDEIQKYLLRGYHYYKCHLIYSLDIGTNQKTNKFTM